MQPTGSDPASTPLDATVLDIVDLWAAQTPCRIAAEFGQDTLTYIELQNASFHVSQALLSAGVRPRDIVPLLTDMSLDMLPALIGILRVGACFAPMDVAAWGRSRIEAALSELSSPVALVTKECLGLQLPGLTVEFQKSWLRQPFENDGVLLTQLDNIRRGFRADYLAWIIFTSGTTGKPKGVMVYHKGIQALVPEFLQYDALEPDVEERGVRCLLAASVAFDGCQATTWGTLRKGRTLVMASPSNFHEVAATCEVLSLTPSMLAALDPSGPYHRVRVIFLGAEAPSSEVYRHWIGPQRRLVNTYGPSETTCIISMGFLDPEGDPTFGEIMSSVEVVLVDPDLQESSVGEIMISGPGLAAGYLNNHELTASKFIQWNGRRFYRTGDLARRRHEDGQLVFMGRADSLIKNRGFLINLETEVEPALLSFEPVRVAVAFKAQNGRLVGCVQPDTVDVDQLRQFLRGFCDPFIIPDELVSMGSFPLNVNGKTDRRALKTKFDTDYQNDDRLKKALINSQTSFQDDYDALRMGFSQILHVPYNQLNWNSSFTALGGHSLTAISLANWMNQRGYMLSAIQILRLDSIRQLVAAMSSSREMQSAELSDENLDEGPTHATDVQKLFLKRSLESPDLCALIGVATYVGDPQFMPTASELHKAIVKAGLAHQVYQTRFSLSDFTLHDLSRLNLDWHEVSLPSIADFEAACNDYEQAAFLETTKQKPGDVEVPYCQVTCISVPGRKAIALVTRIHHVLTDVFSAAMFWHDVERALAGEQVPRGSRIQDFARFMQAHKRKNLDRVRITYEAMLKALPATAVLRPPFPKSAQQAQQTRLGLVRFDSPTTVTKMELDQAARSYRVTATTLVYAAWSLFLSSITTWDRVGFSVSLSGRTVPWPEAQSVLGSLLGRGIFTAHVDKAATVHDWLGSVHKTTLDLIESDGLTHGLPEALITDSRSNTTNVLCFLDIPQSSPNWSYREQQGHNYLIDWYLFREATGGLKTIFEVQSRKVDVDWARTVADIPGRLLEQLVYAAPQTLVGSLQPVVQSSV